jgi:HAMP domain-containing protein
MLEWASATSYELAHHASCCNHRLVQRPPEDEQGRNFAIQWFLLLVPKVDIWQADGDRDETSPDTMTPEPGSSLAGDDRDTEPFQVSHAATTAIGVATDHLHCLLQSVVSGSGTTDVKITTRPWALYSLLRGAVENAATAIWLLAPTSRAERLTRRVRLGLADARHADDVLRLMGRTADRVAQALVDLAPIAAKANFVLPAKGGSLPASEVVGEAGASFDLGAEDALLVWRACSGIAHGDTWALSSLPTHEVLNDPSAAVLNTRVTLDISQLAGWTRRAVRMIEEAQRLYAVRRVNHIVG